MWGMYDRLPVAGVVLVRGLILASMCFSCVAPLAAKPVVPGTGIKLSEVADDFEADDWKYSPNLPKSSRNIDDYERRPFGLSANRLWVEGPHRGTPDLLRRVPTPDGGLEGSTGALLMRTMRSGVPGQHSWEEQQDDLMANATEHLGGYLSVQRTPSVVARVFVPEFEEWERRNGTSFAFRLDLKGNRGEGSEAYWPGIFFQFQGKSGSRRPEDSAHLVIRARRSGHDFRGPNITQSGWWTVGMSVTPDGQVHFYAHPGVDPLTEADHLASEYCYGFQAIRFQTFFFNVLSRDDGRTWSTPWIIDDPELFVVEMPRQMAKQPGSKSRSR